MRLPTGQAGIADCGIKNRKIKSIIFAFLQSEILNLLSLLKKPS
jgi:hypothetical protein